MRAIGALFLLALSLSGCKSGGVEDDPILRLSSQEALERGKELMEAKKYLRAREYLEHAFEVAPNSPTGREALLLSADAYYLAGGETNFIRAEGKYGEFRNRFPTSDQSAYVQLQLANSLANRMLRPDRDQTITRKALEAYEELLRLYPTSGYVEAARTQIKMLRDNLAAHEFIVGRHNFRRRLYRGAIARLEALVDNHEEWAELDRALYTLGLAYLRNDQPDEARRTFERLRREFQDSVWVARIPQEKAKS